MVTTFYIAGGVLALTYYGVCFLVGGDVFNGAIGIFCGALLGGVAFIRYVFKCRD